MKHSVDSDNDKDDEKTPLYEDYDSKSDSEDENENEIEEEEIEAEIKTLPDITIPDKVITPEVTEERKEYEYEATDNDIDNNDIEEHPNLTASQKTTETPLTEQISDQCRGDDKFRCGKTSIFICEIEKCDGTKNCPNGEDEIGCNGPLVEEDISSDNEGKMVMQKH